MIVSESKNKTCMNCARHIEDKGFADGIDCTLNPEDLKTCLTNPSRPFWRPIENGLEPVTTASTQQMIKEECKKVMDMLLEKNRKYGNSAISPLRIFSSAGPVEQINVRIDDKLSRLRAAQDDDMEDAELDLLGYLILKRVATRNENKEPS